MGKIRSNPVIWRKNPKFDRILRKLLKSEPHAKEHLDFLFAKRVATCCNNIFLRKGNLSHCQSNWKCDNAHMKAPCIVRLKAVIRTRVLCYSELSTSFLPNLPRFSFSFAVSIFSVANSRDAIYITIIVNAAT